MNEDLARYAINFLLGPTGLPHTLKNEGWFDKLTARNEVRMIAQDALKLGDVPEDQVEEVRKLELACYHAETHQDGAILASAIAENLFNHLVQVYPAQLSGLRPKPKLRVVTS